MGRLKNNIAQKKIRLDLSPSALVKIGGDKANTRSLQEHEVTGALHFDKASVESLVSLPTGGVLDQTITAAATPLASLAAPLRFTARGRSAAEAADLCAQGLIDGLVRREVAWLHGAAQAGAAEGAAEGAGWRGPVVTRGSMEGSVASTNQLKKAKAAMGQYLSKHDLLDKGMYDLGAKRHLGFWRAEAVLRLPERVGKLPAGASVPLSGRVAGAGVDRVRQDAEQLALASLAAQLGARGLDCTSEAAGVAPLAESVAPAAALASEASEAAMDLSPFLSDGLAKLSTGPAVKGLTAKGLFEMDRARAKHLLEVLSVRRPLVGEPGTPGHSTDDDDDGLPFAPFGGGRKGKKGGRFGGGGNFAASLKAFFDARVVPPPDGEGRPQDWYSSWLFEGPAVSAKKLAKQAVEVSAAQGLAPQLEASGLLEGAARVRLLERRVAEAEDKGFNLATLEVPKLPAELQSEIRAVVSGQSTRVALERASELRQARRAEARRRQALDSNSEAGGANNGPEWGALGRGGRRAAPKPPPGAEAELRAGLEGQAERVGPAMAQVRAALPINMLREQLAQTLLSDQVVVVSGGTGSGKTTQIPQYILDDAIRAGRGAKCRVVVTQPRRLAATAVAARVADERGEPLGGAAVGYRVRGQAKPPRPWGASIEFCTTGILLRRLQSDPTLADVTHVIVDEVHERDINTDFLLLLMRDVLEARKGTDFRLVLMSATLDAQSFARYFGGAPLVEVPSAPRFPVEEFYLEDLPALLNPPAKPNIPAPALSEAPEAGEGAGDPAAWLEPEKRSGRGASGLGGGGARRQAQGAERRVASLLALEQQHVEDEVYRLAQELRRIDVGGKILTLEDDDGEAGGGTSAGLDQDDEDEEEEEEEEARSVGGEAAARRARAALDAANEASLRARLVSLEGLNQVLKAKVAQSHAESSTGRPARVQGNKLTPLLELTAQVARHVASLELDKIDAAAAAEAVEAVESVEAFSGAEGLAGAQASWDGSCAALADPKPAGLMTVPELRAALEHRGQRAPSRALKAELFELLLRADEAIGEECAVADPAPAAAAAADGGDASMPAKAAKAVKAPGSVLVFLPGWDEIKDVVSQLEAGPNAARMTVLPLHSTLTPPEQQRIFEPAPAGTVKVIVATNIAESSVTIADAVAIVDAGKVKELRYDPVTRMSELGTYPASRASATQRRGRAGRVGPGKCYRLYSRAFMDSGGMMERQVPEIQRMELQHTCLQAKALLPHLAVAQVLSRAMDPPPASSVMLAMDRLESLGAIDTTPDDGRYDKHDPSLQASGASEASAAAAAAAALLKGQLDEALESALSGRAAQAAQAAQAAPAADSPSEAPPMEVVRASGERITSLGRALADLPVEPAVGRMLLSGALLGCLDPATTLAAMAGSRSPFVASPLMRDESQRRQRDFSSTSDVEAAVNAYEEWTQVKRKEGFGAASQWAWDNCLVQSVLIGIEQTKRQLLDSLANSHSKLFTRGEMREAQRYMYEGGGPGAESGLNGRAGDDSLRRALIALSMPSNMARKAITSSVGYRTNTESSVGVHPSSVNVEVRRGKRVDRAWGEPPQPEWVCYQEMVASSNNPEPTMRGTACVDPAALLLFAGAKLEAIQGGLEQAGASGQLDGWVLCRAAQDGDLELFASLRHEFFDCVLPQRLRKSKEKSGSRGGGGGDGQPAAGEHAGGYWDYSRADGRRRWVRGAAGPPGDAALATGGGAPSVWAGEGERAEAVIETLVRVLAAANQAAAASSGGPVGGGGAARDRRRNEDAYGGGYGGGYGSSYGGGYGRSYDASSGGGGVWVSPERERGGGGMLGGRKFAADWDCPACGNSNFARRTECNRCGEPKGGGSDAGPGRGGGSSRFEGRGPWAELARSAAQEQRRRSANTSDADFAK